MSVTPENITDHLDRLWENAEQADHCEAGDTLIYRYKTRYYDYKIITAEKDTVLTHARILRHGYEYLERKKIETYLRAAYPDGINGASNHAVANCLYNVGMRVKDIEDD